jgi:hypothetical protein
MAMALRRRESYMDSQAATIKLTCQYRVRVYASTGWGTPPTQLYTAQLNMACYVMA